MSRTYLFFLVLIATGIAIYIRYPDWFTKFKKPEYLSIPEATLSDTDKKEIIVLLNKAIADEWFAYYQYWLGGKLVKGPLAEKTAKELFEHAEQEFNHAGMLADRILKLGGTPLLSPDDWKPQTTCGFISPTDPFVKTILEQNIKGELCAIETYKKALAFVDGKDPVTHAMITHILAEEIKHEQDLTHLLKMCCS